LLGRPTLRRMVGQVHDRAQGVFHCLRKHRTTLFNNMDFTSSIRDAG
jgi:hypothetical protein